MTKNHSKSVIYDLFTELVRKIERLARQTLIQARDVVGNVRRESGSSMSKILYMSTRRTCAAPDTRAEGGVRTVYLDQRCIRIERVFAGVKMRLAVPVDSYRGVVLSCEDKGEQRLYQVTLVHRDCEFSVALHIAADWTDVLSIWQRWARFFGRPAIFSEEAGQGERSLRAAVPSRQRRRSATLAKRRPQILNRRRPGRVGSCSNLLEGAQELVSYE